MVKVWINGRPDPEKSSQPNTAPIPLELMSAPEDLPFLQLRPRTRDITQNETPITPSRIIRTLIPQKRGFMEAFPPSKRPTDLDDLYSPMAKLACTAASRSKPEEDSSERVMRTLNSRRRCRCLDAEDDDLDTVCVLCGWISNEENEATPALSLSSSLTSDSGLSESSSQEEIANSTWLPRYRCHCPGTAGKEDPYYCETCGLESYEAEQGRIALTRTRTPSLTSCLGDNEAEEEEYVPVPNKKGHMVRWDPDVKDNTGCGKEYRNRRFPRGKDEEDERLKDEAFRSALEQIPDLSCLDAGTVEQAMWLSGQKHTELVREVADKARKVREAIDPRLLAHSESKTEAGTEGEKENGSESESESDNDDNSFTSSEMRVAMDEIHHQGTIKALLRCIEEHVEYTILCTHCRFLHHSAFYTTDPPVPAECPSSSRLSRSSRRPIDSSRPRDNLFIRSLNFIDLQTAMKVWRRDDWIWADVKYKMGILRNDPVLTLERELRPNTVRYPNNVTNYWWGSSALTAEFFVANANAKGKDRLMYRTQHYWFVRGDSFGAYVKAAVHAEMKGLGLGRWSTHGGVRGLCDHQKHQKLWCFDDPEEYTGIRRCDQCALEWEVNMGDVMGDELPLPLTATLLDFTGKSERMMKNPRRTVTETYPVCDVGDGTPPKGPEKKGELVILTCWRDFGACRSVCDPRWNAHFQEYQDTEFLFADRLRDEVGWMDDENEEPAQDWELGGIKKAFETVDVCADEDGVGNLKSVLEEKKGKRLRCFLGGHLQNWDDIFTIRFRNISKPPPESPTPEEETATPAQERDLSAAVERYPSFIYIGNR